MLYSSISMERLAVRELSTAKADAVAALVRSLPDEVLRTLKVGLTPPEAADGLEPVRRSVESELFDRRLRDAVLGELSLAASLDPAAPAFLPRAATPIVWEALRLHEAACVQAAGALFAARELESFDNAALGLVERTAAGLGGDGEAFKDARLRLQRWPGAGERTLHILRLAPVVRAVLPRARVWMRQGGVDAVSGLRLAMRDASAMCADGGPILINLLAASFSEPHAGLRLVCAVMDRPAEAFLATTELAPFAEQVLDRSDFAVEELRKAGHLTSREQGSALAAVITAALEGLEELEHAVLLDRERPWGRRVAAQRRALAIAAEARLKDADGRVAAALPVLPARPALKQVRGAPSFALPLDPAAVARAEGSLAFIEGVRRAAVTGGFGGLRAKVIEVLDSRIDTYVEDLLEQLHTHADVDAEDLRQRLQIAADLLGLVRDPSAAQIVRRRMAVAA